MAPAGNLNVAHTEHPGCSEGGARQGTGLRARLLMALASTPNAVQLDALERRLKKPRNEITAAVSALITAGDLERVEKGVYRATEQGRARAAAGVRSGPRRAFNAPPKKGDRTFRQRLWRALRLVRKAPLDELVMTAAADADRNPETNARTYLRALEKAGYVRRMGQTPPRDGSTSNGYARWLLIRDTGPLAPVFNPDKGTVRDPNTRDTVHLGGRDTGGAHVA